ESFGLAFSPKEQVPVGSYAIPLGEAAVKRQGSDISVITYGRAVHTALEAASMLAGHGPSLEVIDLRSLVPPGFDTVLRSVERIRPAIVLHDATTFCGPGAEIAARVSEELFEELLAPVKRIGAGYSPAPYAASGLDFLPGAEQVVALAREMTG